MEIFLFPIIFSIRAAISILLLLQVLSIFTFRFAIDLVQNLYQWSRFISWIAISSYTGRFWWSIFRVIFVVPITLYTFFWTIYDFGPKHRKRSLFDIWIFPFLREFRKWLHNFFVRETIGCVHAFTVLAYTTMAYHLTLDPLSLFYTDSFSWVCDNSATGHICNNKELFTDELVPSIYEIGSATGISTPTLMSTVTLRITDNEGAKHSFVLKNVNYLPSSPVNILSLRRLAELFPDDAGHPDRTGTGISSGYDSHTLYWDSARFSKTFHTASSGLPECLFSSGYSKLDVFSTMMFKVYDDTINWAFASNDKLRDLAQVDNGSSIVDEDGGIVYVNAATVKCSLKQHRHDQ